MFLKNKKYLFAIIIFLSFFGFNVFALEDATMFMSPNAGSYNENSILSVGAYVNTPNQSINAVSGTINFPKDKLEVVSIAKSNSFINFWVQEPSFSNEEGHVNFEGVVLNPGYVGSKGQIILINFKTKISGQAILTFSSGSILANDGLGTNILKESSSANFIIIKQQEQQKPIPAFQESNQVIAANDDSQIINNTQAATINTVKPNIFSSTHPDQNKWYSQSTVKFTWTIPNGVKSVSLLIDKNADSIPNKVYTPAINEKEISLTDGIWYFHSQFKNASGWGEVSHYKIKIDTKAPQGLTLDFPEGEEIYSSTPNLVLNAEDNLSGIDYYKITIDDNILNVYPQDLINNTYSIPQQKSGKKKVLVDVFDKAGNSSSLSKEIVIKTINPPIIEEYPKEIKSGEVLIIKGSAWYDNAEIKLYFKNSNKDPEASTVKTNNSGKFTFVSQDGLDSGSYRVWAEVKDEKGSISPSSEEILIYVKNKTIVELDSRETIILSLVLLSLFILHTLFYATRHVDNNSFKGHINKYLLKARKRLSNQSKKLYSLCQKYNLTEKEEIVVKSLKKKIVQTDKYLEDQLSKINDLPVEKTIEEEKE